VEGSIYATKHKLDMLTTPKKSSAIKSHFRSRPSNHVFISMIDDQCTRKIIPMQYGTREGNYFISMTKSFDLNDYARKVVFGWNIGSNISKRYSATD